MSGMVFKLIDFSFSFVHCDSPESTSLIDYFVFFQQICQQLHGLWSSPFRIIMAMILLYQQLGVASLLGSLMLVLMFPIQVTSFHSSYYPVSFYKQACLPLSPIMYEYALIRRNIQIKYLLTATCIGKQTFIVSRMRRLLREGLVRTDKRVGLMNEILAAMDTVK